MRSLACFASALAIACGGALPRDEATQDLRAPHATLVLVHGMGSFKEVAGVDYFWRVHHMGEVGQPLGYTPEFDAQDFYTRLLRSLHDQGW